jgi:hypothetical protein
MSGDEDDRDDELAEDALWRARHGLPGPVTSMLDAIRERNPQLAEQIVSGDLPPEVHEQIGRDFLERAGDIPLSPEVAQVVQTVLAAVSGPPDPAPATLDDLLFEIPAPATLDDVRAAVAAGEACDLLFEIRNAMAANDPDRAAANDLLQSVGCYSPRSTRRPS